ncbi:unnamed protein product, partial [Staurois parvus]
MIPIAQGPHELSVRPWLQGSRAAQIKYIYVICISGYGAQEMSVTGRGGLTIRGLEHCPRALAERYKTACLPSKT